MYPGNEAGLSKEYFPSDCAHRYLLNGDTVYSISFSIESHSPVCALIALSFVSLSSILFYFFVTHWLFVCFSIHILVPAQKRKQRKLIIGWMDFSSLSKTVKQNLNWHLGDGFPVWLYEKMCFSAENNEFDNLIRLNNNLFSSKIKYETLDLGHRL